MYALSQVQMWPASPGKSVHVPVTHGESAQESVSVLQSAPS
jgi:hypothetical protein